ncbi:hypothetical protein CBR_g8625 [Chara braunii]|uniref:Late embryogenesis abundant protein LEA-2 subgroup domain-containing protein n=1 Tax=Chara braunii TaxID=69332 RepID=A0A388JS13_CHABU|nr:hypothetical protein CBR_g8625 [Chara braunii]|eukprot:GBG60604.1 hypothetical protein CBR_g8625 [Chara braunii]
MASTRSSGTITISGSELGSSPPRNGSGYVGASAPVSAGGGVRLVKKGGRPSAEEFKPPRLVKGGPAPRNIPGSGELSRPKPYVELPESEMGSPPYEGRRAGGAGGGFDGFSAGGRSDGFLLAAGGRAGGRGGGGGGDFDVEDGTDNVSLSRSRFSRSGRLKLSKRFSFYKEKATTPDRLGLLRTGPQDMEAAWGPAPMLGSDEKRGRWCSPRRCCCCCCCSLVLLIFLLGLAALITYLVIRPKAPDFTIEDIRIESFAIRPESNKFLLSAIANITIRSQNPNRVGIWYERMTFDTHYRQRSLGVAVGNKSVHQTARSTVTLVAVLEIRGADVTDVQSDISTDTASGTMPLDIFGTVVVRVEYKGFKSPRFQVKVDCGVVVLIDPATLTGRGVETNKCGNIHGLKLV